MAESKKQHRKIRLVELFAKLIGAKVKLTPILPNRFDPANFTPVPTPLSPETEAQLSRVDWSAKDVMVGTVRTPEQLQFHLKKQGYYVPARHIERNPAAILYIALHEECLGEVSGIFRYGEVTSVRMLKRGQIPVTMRSGADPMEDYLYFTIKEWTALPHPIAIRNTYRGKPQFTNLFLLTHCLESYQLFCITSQRDFRLMAALKHAPVEPSAVLLYQAEESALFSADGFFWITNSRGKILEKIAMQSFSANPGKQFWQIKRLLK